MAKIRQEEFSMTAKFLKAALVIAVVLSLASSAFASEASEAINNFAFNAGKIIMAGNSGGFFFSPYSIISAFGMAYAGAAGETAGEIEEALGITQGIHDSLGALTRNLDKSGYVSSANRLWLKDGLKLRKNYTDTLRLNYNNTAKELDFKKKTEEARREINDWVSAKTNGKINDLLQALDPETQMVITNAVYFNAEWRKKFPKSATEKEKFYTDTGRAKDVDMMKQRDDFSYSEVDGVKAVMLPYKGYKLSMIAVEERKCIFLNSHHFNSTHEVIDFLDAEVIKHRNGAVDTVLLRFRHELARFQDPDDEAYVPAPGETMTYGSSLNDDSKAPASAPAPTGADAFLPPPNDAESPFGPPAPMGDAPF